MELGGNTDDRWVNHWKGGQVWKEGLVWQQWWLPLPRIDIAVHDHVDMANLLVGLRRPIWESYSQIKIDFFKLKKLGKKSLPRGGCHVCRMQVAILALLHQPGRWRTGFECF